MISVVWPPAICAEIEWPPATCATMVWPPATCASIRLQLFPDSAPIITTEFYDVDGVACFDVNGDGLFFGVN